MYTKNELNGNCLKNSSLHKEGIPYLALQKYVIYT